MDGDGGPNRFDDTEWPGALEEAVDRPEHARTGEGQNEPRAAIFERVEDQHGRYGEEAEERQNIHVGSLAGCGHAQSGYTKPGGMVSRPPSHQLSPPNQLGRAMPDRPLWGVRSFAFVHHVQGTQAPAAAAAVEVGG